ncbi:autotransporter outer membrane beta-barrel domain-containing protein [Thalassobacter stenotrophicus]|uniref:autotransporter domain-containing protein n=1 Tax=Thalassobacter stenotrophicus TaxID=266809 RepID=UPI0022A9AA27|nr:autotransporter domain-containing protein [Thalassobacter stenotrophicus]UYP69484.1 autotransporter outer membrane beta-barrel domain-containing protein [Thalassobacter stenotrophicus]
MPDTNETEPSPNAELGGTGAIVVDDAQRGVNTALVNNQRMIQQAKSRFIVSRSQAPDGGSGVASRNSVPFDIGGTFDVRNTTLSSRGSFFGQSGDYAGTQRRLFFGDFDIQHDAETDSTTATLTGRVAWEQNVSEQTMLGYFVGGEFARSNIGGAFDGDQNRLGVTAGGYVVHELMDQIYLDGFATLGAGRNDLDLTSDTQTLEGDYTTRTATIGAAVSGVYAYETYELRPELAFSYGKTWIGDIGLNNIVGGVVDNVVSLDAGDVTIANLTLRPEFIWALDGGAVAQSAAQVSFAPRLVCEEVRTSVTSSDCGGGAEVGYTRQSEDGLSNTEFRVVMDRVGNSTRSSLALNFKRKF